MKWGTGVTLPWDWGVNLRGFSNRLAASTWSCIEDNLGQLWIFGNGLYLYHTASQKFEKIDWAMDAHSGEPVDIGLSWFKGNHLIPHRLSNDGSIWINGSKLLHIKPRTQEISSYLSDRDFLSIVPDPDTSHIWVYDNAKRLRRYNYKNNTWMDLRFKNDISAKNNSNKNFPSLIEDNKLWITSPNDIKIMDLTHFDTQSYKGEVISSNSFNVIVNGVNSLKWIWNDQNELLSSFPEGKRFTYKKILPEGEKIISYWADTLSHMEWFGTEGLDRKGRLYRYDLMSRKVLKFNLPIEQTWWPTKPLLLTALNINELLIGTGGAGSHEGRLYRFNKQSLFFQKISKEIINDRALAADSQEYYYKQSRSVLPISKKVLNDRSLTTDSLEYLGGIRDKENNIWMNVYQNGLVKYEPKTNRFYIVRKSHKDSISLDYIRRDTYDKLLCTRDSSIWTGGLDGTIYQIEAHTRKVKQIKLFERDTSSFPLCEDANGNICISSNVGLALYNTRRKEITFISGMPPCSQAYIDSDNNITGLSNTELWFYNHKLNVSRRFGVRDGIKLDFSNFGSNILNQTGNMEFLISDCYRFPVSSFYANQEVAPLHLTSMKINGREFSTFANIDAVNNLELKYTQNQLYFEFAALNYLPHSFNRYACMLEGLDTGWQRLGSNNIISYGNLAPGQYIFKVKTVNQDEIWGQEKNLIINILPAFWQTLWFEILVTLLIVAFFSWLYQNRLTQIRLKSRLEKEMMQQQKKEAEFQKRMADLTLSALRSQINPHFIFNCLNSIKLYAIQNDSEAASNYLSKFSKLLRLVLDNSRNETIPLADELEVLKLYIEMEAMRFKDKLKYSISTGSVDVEYVEIPPLLLQPYVENAIWHGLMNKESGGSLEITTQMKSDTSVLISIKDDGVGRARAEEIKSKLTKQHKSFGMEITSERIALINQINKTATTISIEDLLDSEGSASGTQVNIQIQIK